MSRIKISELSTLPPADHQLSKSKTKKVMKKMAVEIGNLLQVMYAQKKHNLLVVLQGMDASGKDGTTKNVFNWVSPSVIDAFSFKKPTEEEMGHDFLWRVHKHAPQKGHLMVFVRSHYEDILIQRVHKWVGMDTVKHRMEAINAFEQNLIRDNNTTILKFFLNLSYERQEEKLQERIDRPEKNWKHNPRDWEERKHWAEYMEAYEDILNWSEVPWHVVPVDKKWYRNYFVAKVVLEKLKSLDLHLPVLDHHAKNQG